MAPLCLRVTLADSVFHMEHVSYEYEYGKSSRVALTALKQFSLIIWFCVFSHKRFLEIAN